MANPPSLTFLRTYATRTTTKPKSKNNAINRLSTPKLNSIIPPYPYGESRWYKQSNFGLYGHQKIRFGNLVSERNKIKTRRIWRPNVHMKRLWSNALDRHLRVRITTRVLRTVDKCGGLDEYLLGDKVGRIKELGPGGWKLRWRIMQTEVVKERFRLQRIELGLPPKNEDEDAGPEEVAQEMAREVAEEIRRYDQELDGENDVGIGEDAEEVVDGEVDSFMEEKPKKKWTLLP